MIVRLVKTILGDDDKAEPLRLAYQATRTWYLKTFRYQLLSVGKGVVIGRDTRIQPKCVAIGDYSFIGMRCWIMSQVSIGRFVMIASNVSIVGGDHILNIPGVPSIRAGRDVNKPVVIEDDVWIGNGSTIMHGITLGEGSIIAAGALVTKDVEPYSIVGSPVAKVIRRRFEGKELERHRAILAKLRESGSDFIRTDE